MNKMTKMVYIIVAIFVLAGFINLALSPNTGVSSITPENTIVDNANPIDDTDYVVTMPITDSSTTGTASNNPFGSNLVLTGSNYTEIAGSSANSLNVTRFSLSAWFRTNANIFADEQMFIVNKGGVGNDAPGENLNYGVWMTSLETLEAGFEAIDGEDFFVTHKRSGSSVSSLKIYNLFDWHNVVLTYDGWILRLYLDGEEVVNKPTGGAVPDISGDQPFRIGANSLAQNGFFTGNVDEVRLWNRAISSTEVLKLYKDKGLNDSSGQILRLTF
jgi:hypothetical protein